MYSLTDEEKRHEREWKAAFAKYPILKEEEKVKLVISYQAGNKAAGAKLLAHDMKLVMNMARKNCGKGLPLGDLYQESSIGFMKGLDKFDLSRGFKLSTYVTWWCRQATTRAIENKGKMIRIPSHKQQQANKVRKVYREYLVEEHEKAAPTAYDLSLICDLTEEQISESGRFLWDHISLHALAGGGEDEDNLTLEEIIGSDPDEQPEEQIEQSLDRQYLMSALDSLTQEEKEFVLYKFGFLDGTEKTKREMSNLTRLPPAINQKKEEEILLKLRGLLDLSKLSGGNDFA